jgi:hypothetical protein
MMWIILGSICAFIIALYVFQALKQPSNQLGSKSSHTEPTTMPARISSAVEDIPGKFSSAAKEISHTVFDSHISESAVQNSTGLPTSSPDSRLKEDDQRLRVFDEL